MLIVFEKSTQCIITFMREKRFTELRNRQHRRLHIPTSMCWQNSLTRNFYLINSIRAVMVTPSLDIAQNSEQDWSRYIAADESAVVEKIVKMDYLLQIYSLLQDYVAFPEFKTLDLPDDVTPEQAAYA